MRRGFPTLTHLEANAEPGISKTIEGFTAMQFQPYFLTRQAFTLALLGIVMIAISNPSVATAQIAPAGGTTQATIQGTIQGVVKSGNTPIPAATVTATNTLTGQKVTTWTNVAGEYVIQVSAKGRYVVKAQMSAFATITGEAVINATTLTQRVDLEIVLLSRSQDTAAGAQRAANTPGGRGFQSLSVLNGEGAGLATSGGSDTTSSLDTPLAGVSANIATTSVAVSGNATAMEFQGPGFGDRRFDSNDGPPGGRGGGGPGGGGFGGFGGGGFGGF